MDNGKLIDAANARAAMYDGDDRQDIKADVMNAFFDGAKFGATVEREACAKVCDIHAENMMRHGDTALAEQSRQDAVAIRARSNTKQAS